MVRVEYRTQKELKSEGVIKPLVSSLNNHLLRTMVKSSLLLIRGWILGSAKDSLLWKHHDPPMQYQ